MIRTLKPLAARFFSQVSAVFSPARSFDCGTGACLTTLEPRRLFSTVNVTSFGAGSGGDDTGAINAALHAAKPGDTVEFPSGTYNLSSTVTVPAGLTLKGDSGSLINSPNGQFAFITDPNNSTNLRFTGLSVHGRFLKIQNTYGGFSSNIQVDHNTFTPVNLYDGNADPATIFVGNGAAGLNVNNNTVNAAYGDGFVEGWGFQDVRIQNNLIENGNEGIHYWGNYGVSKDLTVSQNHFVDMHRMCIEIQGDGTSIAANGNNIQGANVSSDFDQNTSCFGISLACDAATDVVATRNKIVSYERNDGTGMRIGIELAGTDTRCYQNDIEGTNCPISLNTSTNADVQDNYLTGSLMGVSVFSGRAINALVQNNDSSVNLSWE